MALTNVSNLFVYGPEEILAANSQALMLRFKRPLDLEKLKTSYNIFVRSRTPIQKKWVYQEKNRRFGWEPLSQEELTRLLEQEQRALSALHDEESVYSEYVPTEGGLPIRVRVIDLHTIVFQVNHVFTNGRGAAFWLRDWLQFYFGEPTSAVPPLRDEHSASVGLWFKMTVTVTAVVSTLVYALRFLLRTRRKPLENTVDLSRRSPPEQPQRGYAVTRYVLSREESRQVVQAARSSGVTMTQWLAEVISQCLFEAQPHKKRMCVIVPADLHQYQPGEERTSPGNYTGSLIIQLFRDAPLRAQIVREFRWNKLHVPFGMDCVLAMSSNDKKLCQRFRQVAQLPVNRRGVFETFSLSLSNTGVLNWPEVAEACEWLSGHTPTQTIFFSFVTLNGRMSMEVCVSKEHFDPQAVFAVTDRIRNQLAGFQGLPTANRSVPVDSPPGASVQEVVAQ